MTAPRFLIAALTLFCAALATYVLVVDRLVIQTREVPYSYRQFLLQSAGDVHGKVVVESGSNSVHGINPFLLSEYFQAPVLTTAGNAGYPLRLRLLNVEQYLQPGDVLLLPLEWNQYQSEDRYPDNFLRALADEELRLEFFYNGLSMREKLLFILQHYPPGEAWRGLLLRRDKVSQRREDLARLDEFQVKLNAFDRASFGNSERNRRGDRQDDLASRLGCNQYLFASQLRRGFGMSRTFMDNVDLLAAIQLKGVRIYLTWPAVTDGDSSVCYRGARLAELLPAYAARLEATLAGHGLMMLGQYGDSHFPHHCFLDTYYHLRRDCADQRTGNLISTLARQQIAPVSHAGGQRGLVRHVNARINQQRSKLTSSTP